MPEESIHVYYLLSKILEGPVSIKELGELVEYHVIEEDCSVWVAGTEQWVLGSNLIKMDDLPKGQQVLESIKTQVIQLTPSLSNLPPPKSLMCLNLVLEREFLTRKQCDQIRHKLFSDSSTQGADLPSYLERKGFITSSQKNSLTQSISGSSIKKMIGGYEILGTLGQGSMGKTYRARQISMDRIVALKVLLPNLGDDEDYVNRFEREAKMAARLHHENIATAFDVGYEAGLHFLSMEYIEGVTLEDYLSRNGPMSVPQATSVTEQLLKALDHAQNHSLVHRDISPRNIILIESKSGLKAKLIDMGLCKSISCDSSHLTMIGVTVGTPAYISPEQALAKKEVDIRSDLYSLGCVFYEMLCTEKASIGSTAMKTLQLHINRAVPSIRERLPDIEDHIDGFIKKMTALKEENRFQSPVEAIEALNSQSQSGMSNLHLASTLAPVSEQLKVWPEEGSVEIKLRADWREYSILISKKLEQHLEEAKADYEFQAYVQTLFTELIANAFDHGCKDVEDGVILLRMELNDAFFKLEVEDPGPGFRAKEVLANIKKESKSRERRRGLMQLLQITDVLNYSKTGNYVKSIIYRKSEGSGIALKEDDDILCIEVKGKGDLALTESFLRWIDNLECKEPQRICLMIRTDYVSSTFVGAIVKLNSKLKDFGSAMSIWIEHQSCYRVMEQLGLSSFARLYDSFSEAKFSLYFVDLKGEKEGEAADRHKSKNSSDENPKEKDSKSPKEASPNLIHKFKKIFK